MTSPVQPSSSESETNPWLAKSKRWAVVYVRIALGTAFLSAVAARFGLWKGDFGLRHFSGFLDYAGQVLSFLPPVLVPPLAWIATALETTLGILLICGIALRWASLASSVLLACFGISMAISFGLQSPMDYSVFSASAAALLLAHHAFERNLSPRNLHGGSTS
jgi:uncharacterized membrane protein YphA (DoxX/SURF4 family)